MSKAAAIEYATQRIRVNAICPGVIMTPMIARFSGGSNAGSEAMGIIEPVGRLGRPEEVAGLALYLASDDAKFVTGTALPIDGGLTAR